ncbi:hypothetical protein [Nostoc sp. FACHB-857]|uniref:Uncharacterized protein n=1 Tax=Nostoc paludosum FACHB-159 TaxID=2692908 RepID=A0ABR8KKY1_9NOSO|nr:hypothetical protein [Nostoc sp. FACHB-857]MBD2683387.1 hypothetical protein [Nostoc sp. FACHB-857]MBD2739705.1 hypothetical protein [Nostoc paludosum FACHB-159]
MLFSRIQHKSIISLMFLLILTVASGIFVYLVSPLREPTFQPNSGNGGSLVPWMRGITESHWLWGANILAFLLSSNLTFITWQKWGLNRNTQWLRLTLMVLAWILLFSFFWLAFMSHLLSQ